MKAIAWKWGRRAARVGGLGMLLLAGAGSPGFGQVRTGIVAGLETGAYSGSVPLASPFGPSRSSLHEAPGARLLVGGFLALPVSSRLDLEITTTVSSRLVTSQDSVNQGQVLISQSAYGERVRVIPLLLYRVHEGAATVLVGAGPALLFRLGEGYQGLDGRLDPALASGIRATFTLGGLDFTLGGQAMIYQARFSRGSIQFPNATLTDFAVWVGTTLFRL